jgi:hypothetical protein
MFVSGQTPAGVTLSDTTLARVRRFAVRHEVDAPNLHAGAVPDDGLIETPHS